MLSKISIDLDEDNSPVIKIEYKESPDVRDKMVKRFMENFGGESRWANVRFENGWNHTPNSQFIVRPLNYTDLPSELLQMQDCVGAHKKTKRF
ncbi:MAG TPA: hypothetical protein VK616_18355 [Flavitalea sp.]|nr:hypothetical protein [Flavitalea sp.]